MGILFSHFGGYDPYSEAPDKPPSLIEKNIGAHKPSQMVPDEADEGAPMYADFIDQIRVAPHKDGTCLVAYAGREVRCADEGTPNAYEVRAWEVNEYILKATGINNPAEGGGLAHPRIVKYLGRLTPGYKLEMFTAPGPLSTLELPVLQIPISDDLSGLRLPPLLLLYYRWALQTLSALEFLHSHEVCLRDFGPCSVWIRPDLSAAVTGFMQAMFPGAELLDVEDFHSGTQGPDFTDIDSEYDEEGDPLSYSPRVDICSWANFMWELVTNEHSMSRPRRPPGVYYPMVYPEDPRYWPEREPGWREEEHRLRQKMFHILEEARLGPILVKAWSGHYRSVTEVMGDVRALLENRGVNVVDDGDGDEILVPGDGNTSWDDIFVTVPRQHGNELRLRENRGLDSTWRTNFPPGMKVEWAR